MKTIAFILLIRVWGSEHPQTGWYGSFLGPMKEVQEKVCVDPPSYLLSGCTNIAINLDGSPGHSNCEPPKSPPCRKYGLATHLEADTEIEDEWSAMRTYNGGDAMASDTMHWKAILFETREALDRYIKHNEIPSGSRLVDVKKGTTVDVKQKKVTKEVVKKEEVVDHYELDLPKEAAPVHFDPK